MTKICNIRWGTDCDPADKEICCGIHVVEVMVREKTGLSEFATVVAEGAKKTMYVSPVSLFDIFDCLVCCNSVDRMAEEEKAESLADEVMSWNDGGLLAAWITKPCHWELIVAADAAMKMYLGCIMKYGDGADECMRTYKDDCQCEPAFQCRTKLLLEDVEECDCINCRGVCAGSHASEEKPEPPDEI